MSLMGGIRCRRSICGDGSTNELRFSVGSITTSAASRPRATWAPSTESPGSNTNAPGIAGNERSSATYTRIASSSARRFTPGILPFRERARKEQAHSTAIGQCPSASGRGTASRVSGSRAVYLRGRMVDTSPLAYDRRHHASARPARGRSVGFLRGPSQCGELDGGVENERLWIKCECGAQMAHDVAAPGDP